MTKLIYFFMIFKKNHEKCFCYKVSIFKYIFKDIQWWLNWIQLLKNPCWNPQLFTLWQQITQLFFSSNLQESLGQTFDMEKPAVHAIVAKMIISEELMASMDEPSECMIMHRTEPSRLQSLSLQLSDKLAQLVENNERLLELRPGGMIFRFHCYTKQ